MSGPLAGYRVVELAEGIGGPYCAMELADAGADVIKVEPAPGDRARGWGSEATGTAGTAFLHLNRNKRSLAIDIDADAGVEAVRRLIRDADMVVADAGWTSRPELQHEALGTLNPRLIYCRLSLFGDRGPWAGRSPHGELIAQLASEATASLGNIGAAPVRMATDIGSMYAAIHAVQAICAGLLVQDEVGGQRIDVSLFGSLLAMRSTLWVALSNPDEWWGFHLDSYVKPPDYGYRCRDGAIYMSLARVTREGREQLYRDLGMDEWVRDEPQWELLHADSAGGTARYSHVVKHIWERALVHLTPEQAMEIITRNGGWAFPKNDYEQLASHPQVEHVGMLTTVEQPGVGQVRMQTPPWEFSDTPASIRMPAPALGQHGSEILQELGYATEDVERLRQQGVLVSA